MGRHSATTGTVGAARAARTGLRRGLPFWTWSVTAAAFVGLLAASLLGPGLQRAPGDGPVTPRQVVVGDSTTAESTPTGSPTTPSGSAPPTTSSSPTSPASSSTPVSPSSAPVTSEPESSPPATSGSPDLPASSAPAPSTAAETRPADSSPTTAAPFDPGPVLTSNTRDGDDATPGRAGSKPTSRADRVEQPARSRRGPAPDVAVAGRKLAAEAGDGRAVGELGASSPRSAQPAGRDDPDQVAVADSAVALPAPSQSPSEGAGSDASGSIGTDAAAPDEPDLQLHLDPTRTQVVAFLGVFLAGLAAALVVTSTRSAGAHRRH